MYNNILVINLMYIGDLLFTTPLLYVLRQQFPEARVAMLADEKNAWVVKHNPNLAELIAIDKKGYHNKLPNYLRLIADIRKRKFDLVINLHANERASAIAAFSGAGKVVGFSAKGFGAFFNKLVKERTDVHQADAYLEVLKTVGVTDYSNNGLEIWADDSSQRTADNLWDQTFKESSAVNSIPVIGLNTGGSWPTKRWTKEGFAALADKLLMNGYGVVFFGGPMDKPNVSEIIARMKFRCHPQLAVFTGETSLLEMAALVKKCAALVSGDSGPMHIAVAQKVTVLSIFGPSNPVRYSPYGQADSVLQSNQSCLGCGEHQCDHHSCMKEISADQVYDALMARLKERDS